MPTGDIMRATLEGHFDGEPVILGFGFVSASGAADFADDAAGLVSELEPALGLTGSGSAFFSPLSVQYKLDGIRISDLSPGVSASLVFPVSNVGGNTTDDAMPPNDALCITWRTGLKGAQNRGRTYLTGFAEDSGNAGYWIPEIQDWANSVVGSGLLNAFGPLGTGNYSLSVIHTVAGGARIIPPTATPIIAFSVHNEVRSLRRRAVGVRIRRRRTGP